ncbi:unnamed protein product [Paramecium sonneborni]|uniref:Sortilin C-terminal domain-containing protein n=1 Tax=Paramecium sonneborni TaxID=65129 RepID=A0A8S1M5L3_9CILI|nr:unnamed protein product [Paramecium sonneborni]
MPQQKLTNFNLTSHQQIVLNLQIQPLVQFQELEILYNSQIRSKYIYVLMEANYWIEVRKGLMSLKQKILERSQCNGQRLRANQRNHLLYLLCQRFSYLWQHRQRGRHHFKISFSDFFSKDGNFKLDYNISNSKCFDGSRMKYYKKNQIKNVFIPRDDQKKIAEPCPCQREDWICPSGYSNFLEIGDCMPIGNIFDQCQLGTTYFKSQEQIKLTQCEGDLDLDSIETQCPKSFSYYQVLLYSIIILFLVFLILFGYVLIRRKMVLVENKRNLGKIVEFRKRIECQKQTTQCLNLSIPLINIKQIQN